MKVFKNIFLTLKNTTFFIEECEIK